jgi:hypothetical protein
MFLNTLIVNSYSGFTLYLEALFPLLKRIRKDLKMELDFDKIRPIKVKQFLLKYGLTHKNQFANLKPVCYQEALNYTYRKHLQTFIIKKDIDTVWNTYATIHPNEAWNGNMISFGVQYSRRSHTFQYLNDPYSGMEKGQVLVLNLKLLWGMLNIAVAHEVAEINAAERVIKLCYMPGGATEGSQWITLNETKEGFTEISHLTYYKSKSNFRDTRLYPKLHTKAIAEFHESVRRKAMLM